MGADDDGSEAERKEEHSMADPTMLQRPATKTVCASARGERWGRELCAHRAARVASVGGGDGRDVGRREKGKQKGNCDRLGQLGFTLGPRVDSCKIVGPFSKIVGMRRTLSARRPLARRALAG